MMGKRKSEIELVVPTQFTALCTSLPTAEILQNERNKKNEKYTHFELTNISIRMYPFIIQ